MSLPVVVSKSYGDGHCCKGFKGSGPCPQVTYYDDIGEAYEWAVKLPVQAISLDFLGVPGSALGNETAALIEKHGFPSDKRLGAGVVDGRSVFADGEYPGKLIAALQAKVRQHGRT